MIKLITLIFSFLIFSLGLTAQLPKTTDSTAVKKAVSHTDTVAKQQPVSAPKQAVPDVKRVRKDTRPLKDRIDFDANTGFWVNTHQVLGQITLLVTYRFPKILSIGAGPTYIYNYQRGDKQNLNGWGGKIYSRAQLLKFFYLWTEYQGIDNQYISGRNADNSPIRSHTYVGSWCVGAGLNIRLGRKAGINLSVMYDLLQPSHSPYYNKTVFCFGFSL